MGTNRQAYILSSPLTIYAGESFRGVGVLPEGTRIYYDRSFPEGFDRYFLFVNVEGRQFPLEEVNPPDLIDPLTSFAGELEGQAALSIAAIKELLTAMGVKKADLQALLAEY